MYAERASHISRRGEKRLKQIISICRDTTEVDNCSHLGEILKTKQCVWNVVKQKMEIKLCKRGLTSMEQWSMTIIRKRFFCKVKKDFCVRITHPFAPSVCKNLIFFCAGDTPARENLRMAYIARTKKNKKNKIQTNHSHRPPPHLLMVAVVVVVDVATFRCDWPPQRARARRRLPRRRHPPPDPGGRGASPPNPSG